MDLMQGTVTAGEAGGAYLRFGDLPAGGRSSVLWGTFGLESAVSVFEARATAGGYEIRLAHPFQIHDLARVLKEGRPLYRAERREKRAKASRPARRRRPASPPITDPWGSWQAETRRWDEEYGRGSMWT